MGGQIFTSSQIFTKAKLNLHSRWLYASLIQNFVHTPKVNHIANEL